MSKTLRCVGQLAVQTHPADAVRIPQTDLPIVFRETHFIGQDECWVGGRLSARLTPKPTPKGQWSSRWSDPFSCFGESPERNDIQRPSHDWSGTTLAIADRFPCGNGVFGIARNRACAPIRRTRAKDQGCDQDARGENQINKEEKHHESTKYCCPTRV